MDRELGRILTVLAALVIFLAGMWVVHRSGQLHDPTPPWVVPENGSLNDDYRCLWLPRTDTVYLRYRSER